MGTSARRFGALATLAFVAVVVTASPSWAARFNSRRFSKPGAVQNENLPLAPGTKYVYRGATVEDGQRERHRLVVIVTDQTKVVDGVETTVVWERDYSNGFLEESELGFYAVDDKGNVWSLGEYPQEYERGRFVGADSSWVGGQDGARPGVVMPANPRRGSPTFVEGVAKDVGFKDEGKVYATGQQTCVPVGCFDNVVQIKESNALDPAGGHQLKYNAPGVGLVRVGSLDSDDEETLDLTSLATLDREGRAHADGRVARLDRHAYRVTPEIYEGTSPVGIAAEGSGASKVRGQARLRGLRSPAIGERLGGTANGVERRARYSN
jgi:hypothetical protein